MKFKVFIVGVVSLFMAMQVTAQNIPYQHWSINFNGGLSGYLPTDNDFLKDLGPSFGLGLEWTANPLWGLSLDYQYFGFYNNKDYGHTNEITLSGQFNLANLLSKFRYGIWKKFNTYGHIGVGGAISLDRNRNNEICGVIPIGILFEYNITQLLALNLNLEGRWHSNSFREVVHRPGGVLIFSANLGIRIKLGTTNHIRHYDYEVTFFSPSATDETINRLQAILDDIYEEAAKHKNAVEEANYQIDALKREIDNLKMGGITPNAPAATTSVHATTTVPVTSAPTAVTTTATSAPTAAPAITTPKPVAIQDLKIITFDAGKSELNPAFYSYLSEIASELRKTKTPITITGHSDDTGDPTNSMRLSISRAKAVADYLISKGVNAKQITTKGMSDTQPIADNKTDEGRQKNRRVELVIK